MSEEVVRLLSVDTGNSQKSLKQLRDEVKTLKNELLNLDKNTEEYNKVLEACADRSKILSDQMFMIKNSATDLGSKLSTVLSLTKGVASGFALAQGAITLFGSQNENLNKILKRTQGAIALVQGLQGLEGMSKTLKSAGIQFRTVITFVKGFTTSLKGMSAALVSTGIGALVVGLGLLIANWDKLMKYFNFTAPIDSSTEALNKLNDELDKIPQRAQKASEEALITYINKLKNTAYDAAQALEEYNNQLKDIELQEAKQNYDAINKILIGYYAGIIKLSEDEYKEKVRLQEEYRHKVRTISLEIERDELLSQRKRTDDAKKEAEKRAENELEAQRKTAREIQRIVEKAYQEIRRIQGETLDIKASTDAASQLLDDLLNKTITLTEATEKYNTAIIENTRAALERAIKESEDEITRLTESINAQITEADRERVNQQINIEKTKLEKQKALYDEFIVNRKIDELKVTQETVEEFQNKYNRYYRSFETELKTLLYRFDTYIKNNQDLTANDVKNIWVGMIQEVIDETNQYYQPESLAKDLQGLEKEAQRVYGAFGKYLNEPFLNFDAKAFYKDEYKQALNFFNRVSELIGGSLDESFNTLKGNLYEILDSMGPEVAEKWEAIKEKLDVIELSNLSGAFWEEATLNTVGNNIAELIADTSFEPWREELLKILGLFNALQDGAKQFNETNKKVKKGLDDTLKQENIKGFIGLAGELQNVFSNLGSLFEDNAEAQKAFAIMNAMLSILQAIAGAMGQMGTLGPWGVAALVATITATGVGLIAQMKQINKDNAQTASIGSSSIAVPNVTASPISYTRNVLTEEEEAQQKDTRVYVVENDITSTQNRVRVRENNSTF